jgi:hypothetical protein
MFFFRRHRKQPSNSRSVGARGFSARRRPPPCLEVLENRILLSTDTWINPGGGNWNNGSNWSLGRAPLAGDTAIINTAAAATITLNNGDNFQVQNLTNGINDVLLIQGNALLTVVSGGVNDSGTIELRPDGNGNAKLAFSGNDTLGGAGDLLLDPNSPKGAAIAYATDGSTVTNLAGHKVTAVGGSNGSPCFGAFNEGTLVNLGTINVINGAVASGFQGLCLNGAAYANSGTIQAGFGAGVGVNNPGATLNNTNGLISIHDGSAFFDSGTVSGGTLSFPNNSFLFGTNPLSTLSNVTVAAGSNLILTNTANPTDNLTVEKTLTNNGTISLNPLANTGTSVNLFWSAGLTLAGTGAVVMNPAAGASSTIQSADFSTLTIAAHQTVLCQGAGSLGVNGAGTVVNQGVVEAGGVGSNLVLDPGFTSNTGTVQVQPGDKLTIQSPVTQVSAGTLTAGTWTVNSTPTTPATLNITSAGMLKTLAGVAAVTLNGGAATFTNLNDLSTILVGARFSLLGNESFRALAGVTNNGHLTLSAGSTLTVNGSYTQGSTGTQTLQMGTVAGVNQVGTVISQSGTVSLAGSLTVTSTVVPSVGTSFDILQNLGGAPISGTFAGLPAGSTFTVKVGATTMTFMITYSGGKKGNDVVIFRVS